MKKIEFYGKSTGDGECFCWDVGEETYKEICGEEDWKIETEIKEELKELHMDSRWLLYPGAIFTDRNVQKKITIIIEDI